MCRERVFFYFIKICYDIDENIYNASTKIIQRKREKKKTQHTQTGHSLSLLHGGVGFHGTHQRRHRIHPLFVCVRGVVPHGGAEMGEGHRGHGDAPDVLLMRHLVLGQRLFGIGATAGNG